MGHKGPLTVVSPSEWRERTSLRMSSRSESTRKVDAAYEAWWGNTRDRDKGMALLEALRAYLREKGGDWRRCDRDAVSGGLMRHIYELLNNAWGAPITRAQKAIETLDIPHSRYGVLYLFGNIEIDMNKLAIALEGVAAVGNAVGTSVSTHFDQLHSEKLAEKTFNVGSLSDLKASDASAASAVPFQVGSSLTGTTGTQQPTDTRFGVVRNPYHRPGSRNPAVLKVYREQQAPPRPSPGWPCSKAMFDAVSEDPLLMLNPYTIAGTAVLSAVALIVDAFNNLRVLLINAVTDLFNWIKAKLLSDGEWAWTISGTIVSKIVRFVVGKCLESAAPIIGGAMDIGGGLMKTIKAAKERIGTWLLRRKININPGHPELLANAIESNMSQGIFSGLWTILKGVAATALAVFLPGAGNLVAALVTGIEWMIKFLWRMWEQSKINKFLQEARVLFGDEKRLALQKTVAMRHDDPNFNLTYTSGRDRDGNIRGGRVQLHPETDKSKGGIITDLPRFKAFYEKGCNASPLIPMLTLNSGICGSLMVMLKMFDDTGDVVTQETWNTAENYFTRLKQYGRSYLGDAGFEFRAADAADTSLQGLLNHALHHHTGESGKLDKLLAAGAALA